MEIRRWLYYAVVNCVLVCCIVGKPFSLNKIIEAESHRKEVATTTLSPISEEPAAERFSLNKGLRPISQISKKFKEAGTTLNLIPLGKKISTLKYRKTFQIKSPLKPKKVKYSLRTRQKRKNQSIKREINGNAILNQKYIPLLRSLGMLFDNILGTDSGESFELPKNTRKRLRYYLEGGDDVACKCPYERESNANAESEEETITLSEALTTEVSVTTEATTETTNNTPAGDLRSFRQNKNVPLLLPRDTFGARRNDHGLSERSRAAHYRSAERDISGDHGDSEHNPEWGQNKSNAESHEEYTDSDSRNDASSVQSRGGLRNTEAPRNKTKTFEAIYENDASKDEEENTLDKPGGHIDEHNGQDKLETGRDEEQSAKLLPEPVRKQRGFISEDEVSDTTESVQSEEDNEESDFSVAHASSDDQRIIDRGGSSTSQDQKASPRYETLTHQTEDTFQYDTTKSTKRSGTKGPVVVIIDGYSVTRNKNGENKLSEKAIRIRP